MGLTEFLDHAAATPWAWGGVRGQDCCTMLADWGLALTGIDGAVAWRGRYSTALGCQRLLNREGGVLAVVKHGAITVGMIEQDAPACGSVGVVVAPDRLGRLVDVGAIYTGRRWALRSAGGLTFLNVAPVRSWSLPCPR